MDLRSLSALTSIPVNILKERAVKLGLECQDGEYRVTGALIEPVNDDGLFTVARIAKRNKVTDSTIRRRFKKAKVFPEVTLLDCQTKLYRLTDEVRKASSDKGARIRMPTKADRLENKGFSKEVTDIIEEERLKKTWVGKQGALVNEQGSVISKGKIEVVSSCGVFVNGVMGDIKMLRLGEE